jgi:hypothetical protein
MQQRKKKVSDIPVPRRDVPYQTLPGREYLMIVYAYFCPNSEAGIKDA